MTDGPTGFQVAPTEDEMANASAILTRMINAVVGMSQLQADVDMLRQTVTGLQADAERLRNQNAALTQALDERDTFALEKMELEDKLKAAEAKLAKVQEIFGGAPLPSPPSQSEPVPAPDTPWPSAPEPTTEEVKPTRHYIDHWSPGASWDSIAGKYYTEA
jgi:hypothetical protein